MHFGFKGKNNCDSKLNAERRISVWVKNKKGWSKDMPSGQNIMAGRYG
jgi:hypothetical protein